MKRFGVIDYTEIIFNLFYLLAAFCLGLLLIKDADSLARVLAGIMAFVLVGGDAFHLVPRIMASGRHLAKRELSEKLSKALNIGKIITSISMAIFYVLLWQIGVLLIERDSGASYIFSDKIPLFTITIYILVIIRIILVLMPQNGWLQENPSKAWAIYRNIPFLLQGLMVVILFYVYRGIQDPAAPLIMGWMWLAVILSFLFYIPVVLWSDRYPAIGSLMLPKTLMYLWIIWMCLSI